VGGHTLEVKSVAWFYEIRSSNNTVLKRDGGFADPEAAKMAAREDAKKMKPAPRSERPDVGRILVGQNVRVPDPSKIREESGMPVYAHSMDRGDTDQALLTVHDRTCPAWRMMRKSGAKSSMVRHIS
jgi:hypothetical protein